MMDWIKKHPYLTGGLVLAAIILFVIIRRASGSATASVSSSGASGPSEGLQAAQLSAGVQMASVQAAADVQNNQTSGAVAVAQIKANSDAQAADAARQVALQNIVTSGQVQLDTNSSTLQAIRAQTGAQVSINATNVQGSVDVAGIQADVMKSQYESALEAQKVISDAATTQAGYVAATQMGIAQFQAQTTQAGYSADVAKTGIAADVAENNTAAQLQAALDAGVTTRLGISKQADVDYTQLTQAGETTRLGISKSADIAYTQLTQQGETARLGIQTAGGVQMHEDDITHDLVANSQNIGLQEFDSNVNLISLGKFNLGGQGGQNTLIAGTAIGVNPGAAASGAGSQNSWYNSPSAFLNSIGNLVGSVGRSLVAP